MTRKNILVALALAAAGAGITLAQGPEADRAELAVEAGVEPAPNVSVIESWDAVVTATASGVVFTRKHVLEAMDAKGDVVGRLASAKADDVTVYSPCYIASAIDRCEKTRGPDCAARVAWAPHIAMLVAAGGSIPAIEDCPSIR